MNNEPKTYNEWKAHYLAVKQRLGGVSQSAGVVPVAMVAKEDFVEISKSSDQIEAEKVETFFRVNKLPKNNFYRLLIKVAKEHDIDPDQLVTSNRRKNVVAARNQLAFEAHNIYNYSYAQIGRWLGKDHTSIVHSANRYASSLGAENDRA